MNRLSHAYQYCLFFYFLFGMHFLLDTSGGSGLYYSFNVIGWICVTVMLSITLWYISNTRTLYYSYFHLLLLLGLFLLIIPLFYQGEFTEHAIPRLLGLTGGILFLISFSQFNQGNVEQTTTLTHSINYSAEYSNNKPNKSWCFLWFILIGVSIQASVGLVEVFFLKKGMWAGFNPELHRPFGLFMQPNVMASFMATGLILSLYLFSFNKVKNYNRITVVFLYFCLVSTSFLIWLLQSRTGYLGFLFAFVCITGYLYKVNKHQLFIHILLIISSCYLAYNLSRVSNNTSYVQRDTAIYQDAGVRTDIYSVSLKMIKEKPVLGYGYGSFERSYLDFYNQLLSDNPELKKELSPPQQKLSHPHNELLYWAIEGGVFAILGLLCFAWAYLSILMKLPPLTALAMLALVTPIMLHSQTEFPFYAAVSHWLTLLIFIFYSHTLTATVDKKITITRSFLLRFLSLLLSAIFLPFLATTLHTTYLVTQYEKSHLKQVKQLNNIINPLPWRTKIENNMYNAILLDGIKNKNEEKLIRYITWGLQRIKYAPRQSIYINLLLCMQVLNMDKEYHQLLYEAQTTYPLKIDW